MRLRLSLRSLFVLIAGAAVCLACFQIHHSWYTQRYPFFYVNSVLSNLKNGDRLEEVAANFHSGAPANEEALEVHRDFLISRGITIEDQDEFWQFLTEGNRGGSLLQFRGGKLVNHRTDYGSPTLLAKWNSQPIPTTLHRFGGWLICLVVVLLAPIVAWVAGRMSAMYVVLLFHLFVSAATYVFIQLDFTPLPGPISLSLVVLPVIIAVLAWVARASTSRKVMVVSLSVCFSLVQSIAINGYISYPTIG